MGISLLKKYLVWTLIASGLICILGMFNMLLEGEAAQLAALSVRLSRSATLETLSGPDFAGQPMLVIWISAFFTKVFGTSHIAYRLPGLIAGGWALYSLSGFCKIYFTQETRLLALIIAASSAGSFFLIRDVRSETYVMAFYMFTIWQATLYYRYRRHQNLVLAAGGIMLMIFSRHQPVIPEARYLILTQIQVIIFAFVPWTLFLVLGLCRLLSAAFRPSTKIIALYTFLFPLVLLCINPYQSPTDLLILMPVGSLIAADYLAGILPFEKLGKTKRISRIQNLILLVLMGFLFCLAWFPFPENNYFGLIHFMALLAILSWLIFFSGAKHKLVLSGLLLAMGGNLVLTSYYYPNILRYQAGSRLGTVAGSQGVRPGKLFSYQAGKPFSLEFYAGVPVQETSDFKRLLATDSCIVYTHEKLLNEFRAIRPNLLILASTDDADIAMPNYTFLNPETRAKALSRKVLIRL